MSDQWLTLSEYRDKVGIDSRELVNQFYEGKLTTRWEGQVMQIRYRPPKRAYTRRNK